jgi:hypothetical protein
MEILEALTGILVSLGFFAAIILSLYFYFRARNQERLAMIEKGYQPVDKKGKSNRSLRSLKFGVFFIGIGIGLFFGYLLSHFTSINSTVAYFFMILLFGGAGLIINYYLESKISKKEN